MTVWDTTVVRTLRTCAAGLGDLLLPGICVACESRYMSEGGLCAECNVELLSVVGLPYCPRCGATIGPNIPIREDGCMGCDATLPRFARVVRLGPYAGPLRSLIRQLKYRRRGAMHGLLARLLGQAIDTQCQEESFDLVTPVPMHWLRRLSRGADHARILARALTKQLDIPLGSELIRVRNTPPQVHLSRSRRIENVRGAFAVRRTTTIEGARVLLVDDVTTTGATANEATRTLLAAGASLVILAVVAKSEPPTAYTQHWKT